MSRYFSFIALLVVIILLAILFYKVMAGFFIPLFLAALLVVIFRPMHAWIEERCKGRRTLAALLTTISIMLAVLVPLALLFVMAAFESQQLLKSFDKETILSSVEVTRKRLKLTLPEIYEDLEAVQIQLDNIAESEQFEGVVNLGFQMNVTREYNDDLVASLANQAGLEQPLQNYIASFDRLQSLQRKIANPFEDAPSSENETSDEAESTPAETQSPQNPAVLLHDFQEQLDESERLFSEVKVQALGGSPFWVWLRETANPSPQLMEEYGSSLIGFARDYLLGLGKTTSAFLIKIAAGLAIMMFSLYYFLLDGPALLVSVKNLSPIDDEHEQELIEEFGKVSRAVVVATLFAALVQAVLGGIGYYFAGLDSVFLLTLLTGVLALVPFVGAAAVWVPCAIWLFFVDNNFAGAIGLGLWGIVISSSDNFIKPYILHGQSNLHPLFALLSILGGVSALGPIGILIGPMLFAFLQTLLKILQREIASLDKPESPAAQAETG